MKNKQIWHELHLLDILPLKWSNSDVQFEISISKYTFFKRFHKVSLKICVAKLWSSIISCDVHFDPTLCDIKLNHVLIKRYCRIILFIIIYLQQLQSTLVDWNSNLVGNHKFLHKKKTFYLWSL